MSKDRDAALFKHLQRSSDARSIRAMIEMAKSEPGMTRRLVDFDADPMSLGVGNGVLDLRCGKLLLVSPDILVTKRCGVEFDPAATCPLFMHFLEEIQPDPDIRSFLCRVVGYCLTGEVGESIFFFLYGHGANGKSVFIELLAWLLGEYATKISTETLMQHQRSPQGPSPDIVSIKGRRMIYANETEENRRLADARVKDLTGGDTLTGRVPYGKENITFPPTHKLFIVGNHRPRIQDNSTGMWRRVVLIPFNETIPEERRDRHLLEKLKAEGQGILNWGVAGLRQWRDNGLNVPPAIRASTAEYRDEQDILGEFLADVCTTGGGLSVPKKDLYEAYKEWAEDNGNMQMTKNTLSRKLGERGYPVAADKRTFRGLALKKPETEEMSKFKAYSTSASRATRR